MQDSLIKLTEIVHFIPYAFVVGLGVVMMITLASAWLREKGHRDWA